MEPQSDQPPLIVIVGETASGKSALALELARQFNGEIIAADSRTVYKGMDIGTAKPSPEEQRLVPHHLLDVASLNQPLTAADFKSLAQEAVRSIAERGKTPMLVGGSPLYVDAMIYDFSFAKAPDQTERARLQKLSVEQLQELLRQRSIPLPFNDRNPRHLIRHLETYGTLGRRQDLRQNTLIIGLSVDKEILKDRVIQRTAAMMRAGLESEVRGLADRFGWDSILSQTIGYQEFEPYFQGDASLSEVEHEIINATMKLAKRQRTWFKRNKDINWISKKEEAVDLITTFLNK